MIIPRTTKSGGMCENLILTALISFLIVALIYGDAAASFAVRV